jgi:hypothetical protein
MTIQVKLSPEAEARLAAEARAQGIPAEKVAERLLHEALAARSIPHGNLTVEELHAMLNAIAEGSDKLPRVPTSAFTRESFYEERF